MIGKYLVDRVLLEAASGHVLIQAIHFRFCVTDSTFFLAFGKPSLVCALEIAVFHFSFGNVSAVLLDVV